MRTHWRRTPLSSCLTELWTPQSPEQTSLLSLEPCAHTEGGRGRREGKREKGKEE